MNQAIFFDDVAVGDVIPPRDYGPLTIVDTVRWAGLQENWQHLHYDRDQVRQHNGLRSFIASGAYRQALLIRMLTDWIGPRGWLRKISVRHTHSTFEGDTMRFSARIAEKSHDPSDPWVACEVEGINQENQQILTGRCTLKLPMRQ
ncbi:MAG TPA: MaoC/PaaZ C-terminal domain-containing protein [Candidatus Binatia bacterium]